MVFGVAHGNFEDLAWTVGTGSKAQERYLATCAGLLPGGGAGGIFRHGVRCSNAAIQSAFSQSSHSYDQLFYLLAKYGFDSVVNLHTGGNSGTSDYFIPGNGSFGGGTSTMQDWQDWVTSVVARYAPGGSFDGSTTVSVYGSNTTITGDGYTWVPKTRYEIWNEPNSPTGNANDTSNLGGINAADAYKILFNASKAIRTHAAANSWTPYIIGFGLAYTGSSTATSYWKSIVDYAAVGGHGLTYTIASGPLAGTYGPDPHSFIDSLGIHPYSSSDPLGTTGSNPIKTTIPPVRAYLDANGGSATRLYITEWGWRGHNQAPPGNRYTTPAGLSNTEWEGIADEGVGEGSQERWEMSGVDVLQAFAATWKLDGACHYRTNDDNSGGSTTNLGLFYDPYLAGGALADPTHPGVIGDQYLKAVALAYRSKLLSPPSVLSGRPVNVLKRGNAIRVVT